MDRDGDSSIDIDDELEIGIGSESNGLPSAGRDGLNLEVCDRLLGGSNLVAEGSWLDKGVAVEVVARGGMV